VKGHDPRAGLCKTHRHYLMDCATFNALWKRSRGRCEICKAAPEDTPHGMLHIDHDSHVGHWAVRGLLCSRCNSSLHRAILDPKRVTAYLANPWWKQVVSMAGVPLTGIPEPGIGAVVAAGTNLSWRRTERGWVRLSNLNRLRGTAEQWESIAVSYGPHRIRVVHNPAHPATGEVPQRSGC
jgi:Recombination endonuclease VII